MNVDVVNNITAAGTCLIIKGSARSQNVVDQTYLADVRARSDNANAVITSKMIGFGEQMQEAVIKAKYTSGHLLVMCANDVELFGLRI